METLIPKIHLNVWQQLQKHESNSQFLIQRVNYFEGLLVLFNNFREFNVILCGKQAIHRLHWYCICVGMALNGS